MVEWLKIGLVMGAIGGLMAGLGVYQRRYRPHPEWVRKLMHMGAGLVALSLPWLLAESWPVVVLTLFATAAMAAVKWLAVLRAWADDVRGHAIRAGHFLPEEAPAETLAALESFL